MQDRNWQKRKKLDIAVIDETTVANWIEIAPPRQRRDRGVNKRH